MTVKEKTAPMDMVRFDFGGDLSPSDGKYIVYGMAKGNRLPDGSVGTRPFAYVCSSAPLSYGKKQLI